MSVPMIELKSVGKQFGAVEVIRDVSIAIDDGEFAVFVGPSGCGKSTLLRMIAGLESIDQGDLMLNGVRINDVQPDQRGIAMVFQSYALYPHMTVAQNIGFSLDLKKVPRPRLPGKSVAWASCCNCPTCWTANRRLCPGGSGSGWPLAGRSSSAHR